MGFGKIMFDRFTAFVLFVAAALNASGTSTTMERGSLSPDHVHCHAYFHLAKPFHRRGRSALDIFRFEGICPHLEPNKASGKAYLGAVRYGHFYVMAPKIGSLLLNCTQTVVVAGRVWAEAKSSVLVMRGAARPKGRFKRQEKTPKRLQV